MTYIVARSFRRAARVLERVGEVQTRVIQQAMTAHNMVIDEDERYYLEQYWTWLRQECEKKFPERMARALDVGCGQGRLTLPLAGWLAAGSVVGVDLTPQAVERARSYAESRGVTNVEFYVGDALQFLRKLPAASFDLALMTEVTFVMPEYRETISEIARVLKPGGLFYGSFRSQYYDLLYATQSRNWSGARLVRDQREGHWGGGSVWFSWQTTEDIRRLLAEAGLSTVFSRGIGIASGIEGDPLAAIARPSTLSAGDKAGLLEIETSLAERYADCGRYILAVAEKRLDNSGEDVVA